MISFEHTMTTTLDSLLVHHRGNITAVAEEIGMNRGTVRRYINEDIKVVIIEEDGKLVPYVADRRNGHYKK